MFVKSVEFDARRKQEVAEESVLEWTYPSEREPENQTQDLQGNEVSPP
jgi:hypothetical protein